MSLWNPEYRIRVNGSIVTSATLAGLVISSGRTDIYSQPIAGYCQLELLETEEAAVTFDLNDSVSVEVKKSDGAYVYLFGGFITDVQISVATAGASALSQRIKIIAVGALARLSRIVWSGNLSHDYDGNQIYTVLNGILYNSWNEVAPTLQWTDYPATQTWLDAENSGLGTIDQPGDYELHSENNILENVYSLISRLATSGAGYIYEDAEGRIGYADSTRRGQYLATNGYVDLDGNHALAPGLSIVKRAGDVRNSITLTYGSQSSSSVTDSDPDSIALYGELGSQIDTTLRNQGDAEAQAAFYLALRANPQFEMNQISYEIGSPEIDDTDRDSLLQVFMGLPLNIQNLPSNMTLGEFQGFVEGWTWTAGYNRLNLTLNVSPIAYSLQAFAWDDVPAVETWNTISPTMTWLDATIVA